MPLAEVHALLQAKGKRADQVIAHQTYDAAKDLESLEKLARWASRFSPRVDVEQRDPPDTLLLDATGLAPLFGGESSFLRQVKQGFEQVGLRTSLGLGSNIGVAWGLAHYPPSDQAADGIVLVDSASQESVLIEQLPVESLRISSTCAETLRQLGIGCVGQLVQIPRDELKARLGEELLVRLNQMLGWQSEVLQTGKLPRQFVAQWLLEHPTDHPDSIHTMVLRLLKQLTTQLAEHDLGLLKLECQLITPERKGVTFEVGLFRPSASLDHLKPLVETQLERVVLSGAVQEVVMRVSHFSRLEKRQQSLFQNQDSLSSGVETSPKHSPELAGLVDRLASRLGSEAIVRPRLSTDAQPELAFNFVSLVGKKTSTSNRRSNVGPLDRPWQLDSPTPLQSTLVLTDGPPMRFQYQGATHHVKRYWGPERIETGWWRRRGICRDYYRVETDQGRRFWLFRDSYQQTWFLHGVFG